MIRTKSPQHPIGFCTLFLILFGLVAVSPAQAAGFETFEQHVNRSESGKTRTASMDSEEFDALSKMAKSCLDFAVFLDGKSDYDVMTSTEDMDNRLNVGCLPGAYGRLPMGDGIEYYVRSQAKGGKMDLSVFPGSRTLHPYNDVACVPGGTIDSRFDAFAAVRIRGFYTVLTNDFGEFKVIELRPPANPPTEKEIDACRTTFK